MNQMGYSIITTVSPEFERAERELLPTWYANSGADEIMVHRIDEGSWERNILRRAEIRRDELLDRLPRGEKVLSLDADCLVLRDLSAGFSDDHIISVARWPSANLGVTFFNLAVPFKWQRWLNDTLDLIRVQASGVHQPTHELEQVVWRPRLLAMSDKIHRLAEWEWNYNEFDFPVWKHELPKLRDLVRVIHFKGHGDFDYARLTEKMAFARNLWPKALACLPSAG